MMFVWFGPLVYYAQPDKPMIATTMWIMAFVFGIVATVAACRDMD